LRGVHVDAGKAVEGQDEEARQRQAKDPKTETKPFTLVGFEQKFYVPVYCGCNTTAP
jgi:hypothetical protein